MSASAFSLTNCNSPPHVALYPLMDSAEITRTSSRYGGTSRNIFALVKFNTRKMIMLLRVGQRPNCRLASYVNTMSPTRQLQYGHALIGRQALFVFFSVAQSL